MLHGREYRLLFEISYHLPHTHDGTASISGYDEHDTILEVGDDVGEDRILCVDTVENFDESIGITDSSRISTACSRYSTLHPVYFLCNTLQIGSEKWCRAIRDRTRSYLPSRESKGKGSE